MENLDLSIEPAFHYDILGQIALTLLALFLTAALINYICGWVLAGVVQRIVRKLRQDISEKINRLPIKYFDKHPYGDTLSRVTNDIDVIGQSLNQSISQALSSIVMLIGAIVMLITISWIITIIALGAVILSGLLVSLIAKNTQKHFKAVQKNIGDMNGYIEENYAGHSVIKAYSAEKRVQKKFDHLAQKTYASTWKSQFLSGLMMPLMSFVGNLGYVVTVMVGGWMTINGRLSIGDIQAAIQYINQIQQPITQVAQITNLLQSTAAATERVFEFLGEVEESPDPKKTHFINTPKGAVEFDKVAFGYDDKNQVIRNLSFKVKPGAKVAIVGPTGAGKTTLVNLLMRFYDPDSGIIRIDGTDTCKMSRATVRSMFGMVLQDTWLASGTIHDNLAFGDLDANQKQITRAATMAHIDHFIRSLPNGYNTEIDEDSDNISAGEKQLLTIARAMLADAPMLILDEATSNVDTRTEVLIQKAMQRLMENRTSFVIAHRLSTIKNSDLILVMKDGQIIEQGNHRELLAKNGFYTQLYNSQFSDA
jgi:ATP-binding cassette subfamily B protein